MNPAAEQITGFAPEDLVGTRLIDLVVDSEAESAGRMLDRLLDGQDRTAELEILTKDGRQVFVETSRAPCKDGESPSGSTGSRATRPSAARLPEGACAAGLLRLAHRPARIALSSSTG